MDELTAPEPRRIEHVFIRVKPELRLGDSQGEPLTILRINVAVNGLEHTEQTVISHDDLVSRFDLIMRHATESLRRALLAPEN